MEHRWEQLFEGQGGEAAPIDDAFLRQLEQATVDAFETSTTARRYHTPTSHVVLGFMIAASLVGCLCWLAQRPTHPLDTSSASQRTAIVRPLENTSCWKLRSAFTESDEALTAILDERLLARTSSRMASGPTTTITLKRELEER